MIGVLGVAMLWFSVVGSAMGVAYMGYQSRVATQQLEALRDQAAALHVQSGQYLLERSTWAEYSRIEFLAIEKLGMTVPGLESIVVIKP